MEIISNYWYIGVFLVGVMIYAFVMIRMSKRKAQVFLDKNPNASRIYTSTNIGTMLKVVTIHRVDGDKPTVFQKNFKTGILVTPGEHTLVVEYSTTRKGVIYRTVTKTTGQVDVRVNTQEGKSYYISYEKAENRFKLEEIEQ
ncbi:hypothetical protein [Culicoidibacter larvae]|uniref:Uncharacterized protein n=1 Tax=Culicoidibacter larvae TaxID=2579976 RepID=A0A5R8QE24_9FIRM|nr:hypothetical protein [Culicoidibacter larvae]TLG75491.1 hypothetical protein FEZ08_05455 [Culicoidibacter larvae]